MRDGLVFDVDDDGPDAAEREARAALPDHLYVDDGLIGCQDCEVDPQLRPVVHKPDCPHREGSP